MDHIEPWISAGPMNLWKMMSQKVLRIKMNFVPISLELVVILLCSALPLFKIFCHHAFPSMSSSFILCIHFLVIEIFFSFLYLVLILCTCFQITNVVLLKLSYNSTAEIPVQTGYKGSVQVKISVMGEDSRLASGILLPGLVE